MKSADTENYISVIVAVTVSTVIIILVGVIIVITTVLSCVLVRRKRQVYIRIINHYKLIVLFCFIIQQFIDPDMKTNEAYGTCGNINTNIQVKEAYGTRTNTNTTIQDTNMPV